jgi:predicted XRE-type DNA-binding protein
VRAADRRPEVYESSGNIFEDMGSPDAAERLAKALLARTIRKRLEGRTQTDAAAVLGISQPDVSDLVRGRLRRFSQERLEKFLTLLGANVRIVVEPCASGQQTGAVTVEIAESLR